MKRELLSVDFRGVNVDAEKENRLIMRREGLLRRNYFVTKSSGRFPFDVLTLSEINPRKRKKISPTKNMDNNYLLFF